MSSDDNTPRRPINKRLQERGLASLTEPSLGDGQPSRSSLARGAKTKNVGQRKFWCCGTVQIPVHADTLECFGNSHVHPRLYHPSCLGVLLRRTWLCGSCANDEENAPAASDDSQSSTDSRQWRFTAIKEKRIVPGKQPGTEIVEFRLSWKSTDGTVWRDSWEKESNIDKDCDMYKRFIESGEAVFDNDEEDQGEEEELARAAGSQPTNFSDADHEQANNPYWSKLQKGYWLVLDEMYDDVKKHPAAANLPDKGTFTRIGLEMFASIPDSVLRALCGSGLMKSKYRDPDLRSVLRNNKRLSRSRPCIYVMEFTDERGLSPTGNEMRAMISYARRYLNEQPSVEDYKVALKIDGFKDSLSADQRDAIKAGERKLLTTRNRVSIATLLNKLEEQLPADGSDRLPFVLRDVGYTDQGEAREKQHLSHQSTNKIMNLFEAISLGFREFDGVYRMKSDVVFLCFRGKHAPLGEIIFSLLTSSYVETGRGFNGVDAGIQQRSLEKYSDVKQWEEWQLEALEESPFHANMDSEMSRIAAVKAEHEAMEEEILRLQVRKLELELNRLQQMIDVNRELDYQNQIFRELDI